MGGAFGHIDTHNNIKVKSALKDCIANLHASDHVCWGPGWHAYGIKAVKLCTEDAYAQVRNSNKSTAYTLQCYNIF